MTERSPSVAQLQEVAEDVYAYIQPDGGWCLNNAGLITAGGRPALIDTAATEARAKALKDAVARVTPHAPGFVINTHPHGDHTFGNRLFADEAVIIAHEATRAEMDLAGMHLTGLWPDVCWGDVGVELPTLTFREPITLHLGDIRAEVMHLGTAHTKNDSVVWLPERRVLFAGDIVMSGATPFCLTGSISGSLAVIEKLRALGPRTIVSGHGPVGGTELLDSTEAYLRYVQDLAGAGLAAGLTPLEAAREADLGPFAALLDSERLVPNLHRAYAEAAGAEPGHLLDISELFSEMVDFHGGLPACAA
ncbi:MBL fold metallo-hydrolase [Streptomyces lavendulae subsp. lavendulae]|uniref:MBL fold metallo-hydrolase n=1 Tax=Streptomyces lavendulae TaxID=1914 RepID=UPI0024A4D36D|nr:MBL fold metallo-hydrolase [Streptomyces lavendulae]GLV88495.1 MBL fold metallo-hydrolase [Streptomyces lavendulae subsp. lavendulae]